jgi:hypothetical protein
LVGSITGVRKNEIIALREVAAARRTTPFFGVSVVKHAVTFIAEAPIGLRYVICCCVVMEDESIALREVAAARRTTSFLGVSVVKHAVTSIAEAPGSLRVRLGLRIMWQYKGEPLREVAAARRTTPFWGVSVVKQTATSIAEAPVSLANVAERRNAGGECRSWSSGHAQDSDDPEARATLQEMTP